MSELAEKFEKQSGTKVNVTYGSSGNFFSQMQNGAPFDLFFSADIEYPRRQEAMGLAEPGTLYEYAVGRIAIWTPADSKVDVTKQGWKTLLDASVEKLAIANPEHAPYGRAAIAAMHDGNRWEIPAEMHAAIEQGAIVLKDAKNKEAARAFLEFVKNSTGRAILTKYGFAFPGKTRKEEKR